MDPHNVAQNVSIKSQLKPWPKSYKSWRIISILLLYDAMTFTFLDASEPVPTYDFDSSYVSGVGCDVSIFWERFWITRIKYVVASFKSGFSYFVNIRGTHLPDSFFTGKFLSKMNNKLLIKKITISTISSPLIRRPFKTITNILDHFYPYTISLDTELPSRLFVQPELWLA